MSDSTNPIIEFRQVTKRFGKRIAIDGVSLQLRAAKTLGIVGESGSGKSTCVRLAVGLERPSEGEMLWRGRPYPSRAQRRGLKRIRRQMGVVFQDPYDSLDARMSIGKIVAEPLRIHGVRSKDASERVRKTLAAVGLPEAPLDSYPARYSGGGRQRIAIARALVLEPDVLLCDEPTASLDVSVQAQIINLLLHHKENRRISTIFVSHDLDLVRRVADDVVVMYAGRVVEAGPTESIHTQPRHPYTAALLEAVPSDHPRRRRLGKRGTGVDVGEGVDRSGCVFAARCPRVQEECRTTPPKLEEGDDGTRFACFYPLDTETARA